MRLWPESRSALVPAAVLAGLAATYSLVGDATVWGECLTIWPPIVWCVVFLPRLALLIRRGRRREAALAVSIMAAFLAVTTEWRPLLRRTDPVLVHRFERVRRERSSQALRVVSWNVAGQLPLDDLAPLDPDLCLLQEGPLGHVELSGRWARHVWIGGFDPATLSRYPISPLPTRRVGPWVEPQVLRLDLGDRAVVIVNVRLVLPSLVVTLAGAGGPSRLADEHRARIGQYRGLRDLLSDTLRRESTSLAILCGDFNTPGGARSLSPLRPLLTDAWEAGGVGWGGTMTAGFPVSRIDQCWVSPGIRTVAAHVRPGKSDHRMLVVDLLLPGGAEAPLPDLSRPGRSLQ